MHDFEDERLVLRIVVYFFWLIIHIFAAWLTITVTFFFFSSDPYKGSHCSRWHDQASMRLQDGAEAVHFRLVFRLRLRPSSAAELPHLPRRWYL